MNRRQSAEDRERLLCSWQPIPAVLCLLLVPGQARSRFFDTDPGADCKLLESKEDIPSEGEIYGVFCPPKIVSKQLKIKYENY